MLVRMLVPAQRIIVRVRMFVRSIDRVHMIMGMLGFYHDRRRGIGVAAAGGD
jgi:hypothetical protein